MRFTYLENKKVGKPQRGGLLSLRWYPFTKKLYDTLFKDMNENTK